MAPVFDPPLVVGEPSTAPSPRFPDVVYAGYEQCQAAHVPFDVHRRVTCTSRADLVVPHAHEPLYPVDPALAALPLQDPVLCLAHASELMVARGWLHDHDLRALAREYALPAPTLAEAPPRPAVSPVADSRGPRASGPPLAAATASGEGGRPDVCPHAGCRRIVVARAPHRSGHRGIWTWRQRRFIRAGCVLHRTKDMTVWLPPVWRCFYRPGVGSAHGPPCSRWASQLLPAPYHLPVCDEHYDDGSRECLGVRADVLTPGWTDPTAPSPSAPPPGPDAAVWGRRLYDAIESRFLDYLFLRPNLHVVHRSHLSGVDPKKYTTEMLIRGDLEDGLFWPRRLLQIGYLRREREWASARPFLASETLTVRPPNAPKEPYYPEKVPDDRETATLALWHHHVRPPPRQREPWVAFPTLAMFYPAPYEHPAIQRTPLDRSPWGEPFHAQLGPTHQERIARVLQPAPSALLRLDQSTRAATYGDVFERHVFEALAPPDEAWAARLAATDRAHHQPLPASVPRPASTTRPHHTLSFLQGVSSVTRDAQTRRNAYLAQGLPDAARAVMDAHIAAAQPLSVVRAGMDASAIAQATASALVSQAAQPPLPFWVEQPPSDGRSAMRRHYAVWRALVWRSAGLRDTGSMQLRWARKLRPARDRAVCAVVEQMAREAVAEDRLADDRGLPHMSTSSPAAAAAAHAQRLPHDDAILLSDSDLASESASESAIASASELASEFGTATESSTPSDARSLSSRPRSAAADAFSRLHTLVTVPEDVTQLIPQRSRYATLAPWTSVRENVRSLSRYDVARLMWHGRLVPDDITAYLAGRRLTRSPASLVRRAPPLMVQRRARGRFAAARGSPHWSHDPLTAEEMATFASKTYGSWTRGRVLLGRLTPTTMLGLPSQNSAPDAEGGDGSDGNHDDGDEDHEDVDEDENEDQEDIEDIDEDDEDDVDDEDDEDEIGDENEDEDDIGDLSDDYESDGSIHDVRLDADVS
ncbi:hypothetical protein CXG81DRAFT_16781 [Caulochytrium protostelioides]|uniref:Uncharacterized protein n=1 Tax=Caulochytrium protostelioides TaxID=1555241 RepID=A0A4P9XEW7_9FUNG|nr:hypothetical protein CXG81DRAFT_16781 [Caulochytrium protostelioides]|eukprot:RKP03680.1 hypothetical protein CXG81DRAFT_16781 [Caulochytrium protostelioides]